jgi:hypothetical protein
MLLEVEFGPQLSEEALRQFSRVEEQVKILSSSLTSSPLDSRITYLITSMINCGCIKTHAGSFWLFCRVSEP